MSLECQSVIHSSVLYTGSIVSVSEIVGGLSACKYSFVWEYFLRNIPVVGIAIHATSYYDICFVTVFVQMFYKIEYITCKSPHIA